MIRELAPADLMSWRADATRAAPFVVDVREAWELERCRVADALHLPLYEMVRRRDELPRDRDLVIVCHHGVRSRLAAAWLASAGYAPVWNLAGGLEAWATDDPTLPRY